jgi:hypothetical protein
MWYTLLQSYMPMIIQLIANYMMQLKTVTSWSSLLLLFFGNSQELW